MAKYTRSFAEDDQELDDLETAPELTQDVDPADVEEVTFKKRYGDLRRHMQQKEAETAKQIQALQEQVSNASDKNVKLPASEEEMEDFMKSYPKVGSVVSSMISKQVNSALEKLDTRLKKVDELEIKTTEEKAKQELARLHPDFFGDEDKKTSDGSPAIVHTTEFHDWLTEQKAQGYDWVYEAIYNNSTNAKIASDAIRKYKVEVLGSFDEKAKNKKGNPKDAAASVKSGSRSAPDKGSSGRKYLFKESEIDRMSSREYDQKFDEIEDAMKNGLVLLDISGYHE